MLVTPACSQSQLMLAAALRGEWKLDRGPNGKLGDSRHHLAYGMLVNFNFLLIPTHRAAGLTFFSSWQTHPLAGVTTPWTAGERDKDGRTRPQNLPAHLRAPAGSRSILLALLPGASMVAVTHGDLPLPIHLAWLTEHRAVGVRREGGVHRCSLQGAGVFVLWRAV